MPKELVTSTNEKTKAKKRVDAAREAPRRLPWAHANVLAREYVLRTLPRTVRGSPRKATANYTAQH